MKMIKFRMFDGHMAIVDVSRIESIRESKEAGKDCTIVCTTQPHEFVSSESLDELEAKIRREQ